MMKRLLWLVLCGVLAAGGGHAAAQEKKDDAGKAKAPARLLRHVVLFKFNAQASDADIKEVTDAFSALPGKIDVIEDFEWGTDVSVEQKTEGYTHCFLVTFRDEKGRDEYLPHPAHNAFKEIVKPRLEKALVLDYWSKR